MINNTEMVIILVLLLAVGIMALFGRHIKEIRNAVLIKLNKDKIPVNFDDVRFRELLESVQCLNLEQRLALIQTVLGRKVTYSLGNDGEFITINGAVCADDEFSELQNDKNEVERMTG